MRQVPLGESLPLHSDSLVDRETGRLVSRIPAAKRGTSSEHFCPRPAGERFPRGGAAAGLAGRGVSVAGSGTGHAAHSDILVRPPCGRGSVA